MIFEVEIGGVMAASQGTHVSLCTMIYKLASYMCPTGRLLEVLKHLSHVKLVDNK